MKNSKPIFYDKIDDKKDVGSISFVKRKLPKELVALEKGNLMSRIESVSVDTKTKTLVSWRSFLLRYAAASVALILAFALLFSLDRNTFGTTYGEVTTFRLPDGTSVTLNGNSSLSYSSLHWKFFDNRKVKLEGEAFFDVVKKKLADKPIKFQVITENLEVEVLGTRFNVIDRADNEVVVLEEGKVQVSLPDNELPVQLLPGDYIRYDKMSRKVEQGTVVTEGFTSWKDNYIILDNKTLRDLAQIITTVYGKKVVFKNEADKQIILAGKVPSDEIEMLVNALRLATKLNVSMEGGIVFIN